MAYALNRAMPPQQTVDFIALAEQSKNVMQRGAPANTVPPPPAVARQVLTTYVRTHEFNPTVLPALAATANSIGQQLKDRDSLAGVPASAVANVRNDIYLASEALKQIKKIPRWAHASERAPAVTYSGEA